MSICSREITNEMKTVPSEKKNLHLIGWNQMTVTIHWWVLIEVFHKKNNTFNGNMFLCIFYYQQIDLL